MEQYGKILVIAMPIFVLLVLIEKIYGLFKGEDYSPPMDTISSLSSGVTNVVKDVLGLSVTILAYGWLVERVAIFHLEASVLTFVIAFVVIDFKGYWAHRWAHEINIFWNKHAIHHSSEEYNLACALRQELSSFVNVFTFLLLPAAVLGVPAIVINILLPLHLFAQFWYHTRHIGKLGFLEYIIVTPSHHRVHHAVNREYMDKNHSQIFIFWDKLFGTYQEELPDVPPVYGISRPAQTWNPVKINFQHLWLLIQDAWRAKDWMDKFRIWFMPTGWRPQDVENRFPVSKIEDVYHFEKYNAGNNKQLINWTVFQFVVTSAAIMYFFGNLATIGSPAIFVYGFFVLLTVYSYTELMDMNKFAVVWEALRFTLGIGIIYYYGDWFGLSQFVPFSNVLIIGYLMVSVGMAAWCKMGLQPVAYLKK